jgi:hypothetical protein
VLWNGLMSLSRFAFQACAFNHSAVSPTLESTSCERSKTVYRKTLLQILLFCDHVCIRTLTNSGKKVVRIVSDLLMWLDHLRPSLRRRLHDGSSVRASNSDEPLDSATKQALPEASGRASARPWSPLRSSSTLALRLRHAS